MYIVAKEGKLELGLQSWPGDDFHIGWVTPNWVHKFHWWFFRIRIRNGFGFMILGFHITWWRRRKRS